MTPANPTSQWPRGLLLVLLAPMLMLAGCGKPQLMPTPNLYADGDAAHFADVPSALRNNRIEVLYLTDRAPEPGSTPDRPSYGHRRSRSVGFGVCEVRFGNRVSWDQLVRASTSRRRAVKLDMVVTKTTEHGRFPPTPRNLVELAPKPPAALPSADADFQAALHKCQRELSLRLGGTPVKDVYVYVHGVKNSFEDSVLTIAELWHFLGRQGVAVAYSWPAGGKGLLRGYNYDYNSSEFTVHHFKQALRAIASNPDVRKVHIIAHSRGTDVTVSANRELFLEISGAGRSTREELKLGTVVLAASDLDVDVAIQRAATARLGTVPERAVIYVCQKDEALGMSRFLFGSMRIGMLRPEVFARDELDALKSAGNPAIIDARVARPGAFGHNYFYSNPAVSSDLILLLRYQRPPGAEHGRPLRTSKDGFWFIDDHYPRKDPRRTAPAGTRPTGEVR